jgi:hypothetical protein
MGTLVSTGTAPRRDDHENRIRCFGDSFESCGEKQRHLDCSSDLPNEEDKMSHESVNLTTVTGKPGFKFHPYRKSIRLIGLKLAVLGSLLSVNPWGAETSKAGERLEWKGAGEPRGMSQMNTVAPGRPPIDVSAPGATRTATFAMG